MKWLLTSLSLALLAASSTGNMASHISKECVQALTSSAVLNGDNSVVQSPLTGVAGITLGLDLNELVGVMLQDTSRTPGQASSCRGRCLEGLIHEYGTKHVMDLNGDGRVSCDDLAVLLYLYRDTQPVGVVVSIECTGFWAAYRRNVAFLKHSEGVDVNSASFEVGWDTGQRRAIGEVGEQFDRKTDLDYFRCRTNGQCGESLFGGIIRRCDGFPQCADLSDEQDCAQCSGQSVQCLVNGAETCLPRHDLCKYKPDSCSDPSVDLSLCRSKTMAQKYRDCKETLVKNYETFSALLDSDIHYRSTFCKLNKEPVSAVNDTRNGEEFDETLPGEYHEFQFINYNMSQCDDQVDQRLGACHDPCPLNLSFKCNNGRCIDEYWTCDGYDHCSQGEDETIDQCLSVCVGDAEYELGDAELARQSCLAEDEMDVGNKCFHGAFPCYYTGHCISNKLVCDGLEDCPNGEDEDFFNLKSEAKYFEQGQNWVHNNSRIKDITTCFKQSETTRNVGLWAALLFIFMLSLIFALLLEPKQRYQTFMVDLKEFYLNHGKACCPESDKFLSESCFKEMLKKVKDTDTAKVIDIAIMSKKFQFQRGDITFSEYSDYLDSLSQNILKSSKQNLVNSLIKLRSLSDLYPSLLKDFMTSSIVVKIAQTVLNYFSAHNLRLCVFKCALFILLTLISYFAYNLDFFFDVSLVIVNYSAYSVVDTVGFSFGIYFLALMVFSIISLTVAHLFIILIGSQGAPFHIEKWHKKALFLLSLPVYPFFYLVSFFSHLIKNMVNIPETFQSFLEQETITLEYQMVITEMRIVKNIFEQMPHVLIAVVLSLSVPLRIRVTSSGADTLLYFVFIKAILSVLSFSWQLATYQNLVRKGTIGLVGRLVLSTAVVFWILSRLSAVTFCLIFSSVYPDIPFYLYWLSAHHIYAVPIPPQVREVVYNTSVSPCPLIFGMLVMFAYPFVYIAINRLFFFTHADLLPNLKDEVLTSIINCYCPVKHSSRMKKIHSKRSYLFNTHHMFLFAAVNLVLLAIPFACYGLQFFTRTLPVLDELLRYFNFTHAAKFTKGLPSKLPTLYLKSYLIFPLLSAVFFFLAVLFYCLYQKKFHLWSQISQEDIKKYHVEKGSEMVSKNTSRAQDKQETVTNDFVGDSVLQTIVTVIDKL